MSLPDFYETPPSKEYHTRKKSVTKPSSGRSKGINFNTVSPYNATHNRTASIATSNSIESDLSASNARPSIASPEFQYDFALPSLNQLNSMDIDEQLRLLAMKEMTLVEINDRMNILRIKQDIVHSDIHQLREVIQRSLYKEMNFQQPAQRQRQVSNPREEALHSMKTGRRRSLSIHKLPTDLGSDSDRQEKQGSSLWDNLSKPINFIHQLDNMLNSDMERYPPGTRVNQPRVLREQRRKNSSPQIHSPQSLLASEPSPLKSKSTESPEKLKVDLDKYFPKSENTTHEYKPSHTEDMLQTVSSSIWSFVNDVKTNMIASVADPPPASTSKNQPNSLFLYSLEDTSAVSLAENDATAFLDESDEEADKVDLSMYSAMRRKKS